MDEQQLNCEIWFKKSNNFRILEGETISAKCLSHSHEKAFIIKYLITPSFDDVELILPSIVIVINDYGLSKFDEIQSMNNVMNIENLSLYWREFNDGDIIILDPEMGFLSTSSNFVPFVYAP